MGAFGSIRAALESGFSGLSTSWTKFYEGMIVEPVEGESFMVSQLLPASSLVASIGLDPLIEHQGVFQITLYAPSGLGSGAAFTEADSVNAVFKAGAQFSANGVSCRITECSIGSSTNWNSWYALPVSIRYRAFTTSP